MTKRQFKPEATYQILEEARQPGTAAVEVCRRHQIASSLFYKWESEARQGALAALSGLKANTGKKSKGKNENERQQLQEKISRLRAVISEITEENLGPKETFGD